MNQRNREIWRKVAHIIIGTIMLLAAYFMLQNYGSDMLELSLVVVLGVLVIADILIADYRWKLPLYHHLQRKHEEKGLHTATLDVLIAIIVYKLFALPIAIAAIMMLVYGDAAAAIAGLSTKAGRNKRTMPRIMAMLTVSVLIGWLVFGWIGAIMGIVATIAEFAVTKIDDDITIPLFAGLAGHILMLLFL